MEQPRGQSSLGSGEKHKGGALAGTPAAAEGLDLRFPLRRGFRSMYEGGGGRRVSLIAAFVSSLKLICVREQPTSCLSRPLAASMVPGRHMPMFLTFYYFPKWEHIFIVTVY